MNTPTVVIALIIVLFVFLPIAVRRGCHVAGGPPLWPFYVKRLLTQPEQVLYHRLVKALPNHVIFAQVQVSRVLGVKKGFRFHEWNNRINRMSYDFVVCDKSSAAIAAIELDDKSHERYDRRETDAKKNKATADGGLRLTRWHVKSLPHEGTIQRVIDANDPAPSGPLPSIFVERRDS